VVADRAAVIFLTMEVVQRKTFETAEAFLDNIGPRSAMWEGRSQEWAFRGHADSTWSLIPSALRKPIVAKLEDPAAHPEMSLTEFQIPWEGMWPGELMRLANFMQTADEVALTLPDQPFARNTLHYLLQRIQVGPDSDTTETRKFIDEFGDWPPGEVLSVMALAQHHGLETRLLDWSRRARTAAYFAALGAAPLKDSDPGFLMVWALRIDMAARAFPPQPPNRFPRVEVVMPPLSTNPRMAAQAGFFTVDRSETAPEGLDVTIANQARLLKQEFRHLAQPALWQFLLRKSQAGRLLKLLAIEDVHGATVFPGFDGVVSTLTERRYWR
jgi:hypothetical protein